MIVLQTYNLQTYNKHKKSGNIKLCFFVQSEFPDECPRIPYKIKKILIFFSGIGVLTLCFRCSDCFGVIQTCTEQARISKIHTTKFP